MLTAVITIVSTVAQPDASSAAPLPCDICDRLQTGYPLAFFFRQTEAPMPFGEPETFEEWESTFNRLNGIAGKALDEDIAGRSSNIPRYTQFKQENPHQLVLLHFSGNARSHHFPMPGGFAGSWLHRRGSVVLDDVPAETGQTTLRVTTVTGRFLVNIGLYGNRNNDVVLCDWENDRPDYNNCEETSLVSIDEAAQTIVVERGQYGTTPRAFKGGKAYAAAHVSIGPWQKKGDLLWYYNYSTLAPVGPDGRRAYEVLADELSAMFQPGGSLAAFDGILLDNVHWQRGKMGDYDGDGFADNSVVDGVNTYGLGYLRFAERLRAALPDKLIVSDGQLENSQRAFGPLNGIESEGFPSLEDYEIDDWSGGINRLTYWQKFSQKPTFTFIVHKFVETYDRDEHNVSVPYPVPPNISRLSMAGALLTGATITYSQEPAPEPGEKVGIWDELVQGADRKVGWLGRALSEPKLMAHATHRPNLLRDGPGIGSALAARFEGVNTQVTVQGNRLRVAATSPGAKTTVVVLRDLPVTSPDLLITLLAASDRLPGYPVKMARLLRVSLRPAAGATGTVPAQTISTWVGVGPNSSQFYFRDVNASKVDVRFEFEDSTAASIREIAAFGHSAAAFREFEHGVVLANPGNDPITFDLATLFPGNGYRRILANSMQDRVTNDGSPVGSTIAVPRRDAIMLVRTR